jgi:ribonucleotide reductase alpha subunit
MVVMVKRIKTRVNYSISEEEAVLIEEQAKKRKSSFHQTARALAFDGLVNYSPVNVQILEKLDELSQQLLIQRQSLELIETLSAMSVVINSFPMEVSYEELLSMRKTLETHLIKGKSYAKEILAAMKEQRFYFAQQILCKAKRASNQTLSCI